MLFAAIAAALFVGRLLGNFALGFLILGILYAFSGWLVYKMRRRWIIAPVVKMFQNVLYTDEGIMEEISNLREQAESMVTNEEVAGEAPDEPENSTAEEPVNEEANDKP